MIAKEAKGMKKSAYSVVLADDVISKIDKLAYMQNTNRSNMINQILAEYVSLTTPEKRISSIFEELARCLYSDDTFSELAPPTPSIMSIRSALAYKYNPTVKYTVELYREPGDEQGVIKVSTRTTNPELMSALLMFYRFWADTEAKCGFKGEETYENGVFVRPIMHRISPYFTGKALDASAGTLIASYISLFDRSMKYYFSSKGGGTDEIRHAYINYLKQNSEIV